MVSIDVSALDEVMREGLAAFVESKLMVKSEQDGSVITFEDKSERTHVSSPQIKTYLKRYMLSKGIRKKYRLLSEGGTFKFFKLREDQIEEEEEEEESEHQNKDNK